MSSQIFCLSLQSNYSLELIYLSQPCRWCSMVGLYYCISFIPIISPCIIIFGGVGHFYFVKQN
nr:MAG TPA: hypothetical protein [Caudoviricetes sp.]